jgi:spore coat protein U-like protein
LTGLAAGALGLPLAGQAATTTAQFTVSATVLKTCRISATDLAFGDYDPEATAAKDASSTITVRCTKNTTYNVGLNAGNGSGATVTDRKMTGPNGATLNYGLYRDAARTTNWGNTAGTDTEPGTGTGATQTFTVYGRIPADQWVEAGSYTDTITATITY